MHGCETVLVAYNNKLKTMNMGIVIYLLRIILMLFGISNNVNAQVSNDNEDGVYQIPSYNAKDFVLG